MDSMEFVHDWIQNPLATSMKVEKVSVLERARGIFLRSLKSGELIEKLKDLADNPPEIVPKERIVGAEASVLLCEVVTTNRIPQLKHMIEHGYDPCSNMELGPFPGEQQNPLLGDDTKWTIAHEAVMAGAGDALKELMENGLDITQVKSDDDWTLVHAAAYSGNAAVLKIVLDAGVPADTMDVHKRTPLLWATQSQRFMAARLLIWHKADLNSMDKWRNTPLTYAEKNSRTECGDYVLRAAKGEFDGIEEPPVADMSKGDEDDDDGDESDSSEIYQSKTMSYSTNK